ncbi:MAG: SPOR domain-containing protein [bacterium]
MRRVCSWRSAVWVACVGLIALFPGCGGCPREAEDTYSDGVGLFLAGHHAAADRTFRDLTADYPHSAYASDAEYFRGAIALQRGDVRGAEQHFHRVLAAPRNPQMAANAAAGLARCHLRRRQYGACIAHCRQWLDEHEASPRADEMMFLLAEAYAGDGQATEASRYYRQVAGRFPSGAWAPKAQARLRGDSSQPAPAAGGSHWVQVMALGQRSAAERHARRFRERNYPAAVAAMRSGGRTLYAVRIGPYASEGEAQRVASKLRGQGFRTLLKP